MKRKATGGLTFYWILKWKESNSEDKNLIKGLVSKRTS